VFRIGEEVLYLNENDQWITAKICNLDDEDDDRPWGIELINGELCWPNPERLKKKIRLSSNGYCPICGSSGIVMFVSFRCSNTSCQNSGK